MMPRIHNLTLTLAGLVSCLAQHVNAAPLGSAFTYQGQLKSSGSPLNATADFEFSLWDSPDNDCMTPDGTQIGATQTISIVTVADGLFTVELNGGGEFGASAFDGNARWLQIAVRSPAGSGAYTTLCPRQSLTQSPFANTARKLILPYTDSVVTGPDEAALSLTNTGASGSGYLYGLRGISQSPTGVGVKGDGEWGIWGRTTSNTGFGVFGQATASSGPSVGVHGDSLSATGTGVSGQGHACGVAGYAPPTTGNLNYGVWGKSDSTQGIGVYGESGASSGITYGVFGKSNSNVGHGVHGEGYFGIYGESSDSSGRGVQGAATATSGSPWGVFGSSSGSTGRGVYGYASATSTTNYGVYGETPSAIGRAVYGLASANSGANYGGLFSTNSTSGRGVHGIAAAETGTTYGVSGFSYSQSGRGVYGLALDSSGSGTSYGVFGDTNNPLGYGVHGEGPSYGVHGDATGTSGTNYGVYGSAAGTSGRGVYGTATSSTGTNYGVRGFTSSASGYAVYASGDMGASGNKPFRIDHPMDPENKYLLHYASEAPEPQNFYNGTVMLDERGQATVELPEYFSMINRDPRYLLTPIGAAMPHLHVGREINAESLRAGARMNPGNLPPLCSFSIAGGSPNGRVSWEVKAIRNDRWNQRRGIAPVVVEKDAAERGRYQHPDLFGQPAEKGVDYRPAGVHISQDRWEESK